MKGCLLKETIVINYREPDPETEPYMLLQNLEARSGDICRVQWVMDMVLNLKGTVTEQDLMAFDSSRLDKVLKQV